MSGLETIVFSIIGTCLALVLIVWVAWTYINTTDNQPFIQNILRQVEEISKFPQLLKSQQAEIQNILTLIEVLERPITQEFITKLNAGLVPTLDLDPYIGNAMDDITTAIRNEIASMTANLNADIVAEMRRQARNLTNSLKLF
jgi:hypothetical protein